MKKNILFAIALVLMLLILGLSTATGNVKIKRGDIYDINFKQEKQLGSQPSIFEDFMAKHGLKIWVRGYGEFICNVIENNEDDPEEIWGPRFLVGFSKENTILYDFFDENALTLINTPIPISGCWVVFLLTSEFPRLNHRFPKSGSGPHETGWGYFMGGICKGKTYEGEEMPPLEINGATYAYYEIRGRSSICLSNDFSYFPSLKNFDYFSWVLQNRKSNLIPWESWED